MLPEALTLSTQHSVSTQHSPSALSQHSVLTVSAQYSVSTHPQYSPSALSQYSALTLSAQSALSTHPQRSVLSQHSPSVHTFWPLAVQCCPLGTNYRQDQDCVPWYFSGFTAGFGQVFPELCLCWWLMLHCCFYSQNENTWISVVGCCQVLPHYKSAIATAEKVVLSMSCVHACPRGGQDCLDHALSSRRM